MNRAQVIARIKAVEPALRARGVAALYLFGSYARDEALPVSDIDVLLDAGADAFYDLSNFMGAYAELQDVFPDTAIGYATRSGLSARFRKDVEREAIRVF